MKLEYSDLEKIEKLVLDIIKVERNHLIPGTEFHENVAEHSFSVAMLCWKLFDVVHPPLDIVKVFKYALAHDFLERGQKRDVNTYAPEEERNSKKTYEAEEIRKIGNEFNDFDNMVLTIKDYEKNYDEESLFVWSADKMQAIILGKIDNWRPYSVYGISYEEFCKKGEEFLFKCSPYLKDIFALVLERGRQTYYDQPTLDKV